ncbi:MAG: prepilin peptidase [Chitinophagales bacterium]
MDIAVVFVLGLIIGSFANVIIARVPVGESIVFPGSHCPACGHSLKAMDLIPCLSYVALGGHCRYCGGGISLRYPAVELLNGIIFGLCYLVFGFTWHTLLGMILSTLAIVIFFIDLDHKIIPNKVVLAGLILLLPVLFLDPAKGIADSLIGMAVLGGLFFILCMFGGMGGGDVKLGALLGLVLGWKSGLVCIFIASLVGFLVGMALRMKGKFERKEQIAFGPFLAIGAMSSFLYGQKLIDWYMSWYR